MLVRGLVLVLALITAPVTVCAQQPAAPSTVADSTVEVRLRDGSVLFGRIVERNDVRIVLVTGSGARLELTMLQVESIRPARRDSAGRNLRSDPNPTRLFFAPTARPLPKGEGYIASYFLFFPMMGFAVTDRLMLAGGTPILPGLMGSIWYFAPKLTVYDSDKLSFAVGGLGFFAPVEDRSSVGILYGSSTYGSPDKAITLGAGWGYTTEAGNAGVSNRPVILVGGERRVSPTVKLVTENWIGYGDGELGGFVTGGARFIGDRLTADLGLGTALGVGGGCCLPMVNFVYSFGVGR
jgi:hypothetical protein